MPFFGNGLVIIILSQCCDGILVMVVSLPYDMPFVTNNFQLYYFTYGFRIALHCLPLMKLLVVALFKWVIH